ncbi:hypothetical protein GCK32_012036 [Trichostrongylus colubriformis]|uniref:Transthyretin-like family protein n=1 Tax=Trichostrongylus colubriformis TaxID=6319 RepID=A0AAN8EN64_TRICO
MSCGALRAFLIFHYIMGIHTFLRFMGREQVVGVTGFLYCNGKPVKSARLLLYDRETFSTDKLLALEDIDDELGHFHIKGTAKDMFTLRPVLYILHKCDYRGACHWRTTVPIPQKYVTKGKYVDKYYDLQKFDLSERKNRVISMWCDYTSEDYTEIVP